MMANWPYSTAQWKRLRLAKLRQSPFCEPCMKRGKRVTGAHVDHITSIASGGLAFPPLDGLMTMCHSCHSIKTAAVDRPGGKGVRFKGAGLDGLPVDPSHSFFGGNTPSEDEEQGDGDRQGTWILS